MAGFTYGWLNGFSMRKCGTFASCVSSIMIEQVGPHFELNEAVIKKRQQKLNEIADFKVQLL
jgi:sugar/nucleoside kinase (ribokinase family)